MTDQQRRAIDAEQHFLDQAQRRRSEVIEEVDSELGVPAAQGDRVALARRDGLRRRRSELLHAESGLVFGRLDGLDGQRRYLGRVGLPRPESATPTGADGAEPLLLDWRAGAARAFYTATALDPQGVWRRRHIRTRGAQVVGVDDEVLSVDGSARRAASGEDAGDLVVGEAALLAALDERRTGAMGTAIATLQREQDEIIRADPAGTWVVQGGPGTGKTVVALHRVAYLLFSYPAISAGGVLVLGPSPRFIDYISQVLPALGESAVVTTVLDDLLPGVRATRPESRVLSEIKGRALWQDLLGQHVQGLLPRPRELSFRLDGEECRLSLAQVTRLLQAAATGRSYHGARRAFLQMVQEQLTDLLVDRRSDLLTEVESGLEDLLSRVDASLSRSDDRGVASGAGGADVDGELSAEDIERIEAAVLGDPGVDAVVAQWWPQADPGTELRALLGDASALRRGLTAAQAQQVCQDAIAAEPGQWAPGDLPLLDTISDLIGDDSSLRPSAALDLEGIGDRALAQVAARTRDWAYGHVVVDEAQELSAMQWRMVLRRSPSGSVTAVGDIDQADSAHLGSDWSDRLGPVASGRWRLARLQICYRTPAEAMDLAAQWVTPLDPGIEPPRPLRHSGYPPRQVSSSPADLPEHLAQELEGLLARWEGGTVGVVVPVARLAAVRALVPQQVAVVDASGAKGLEWDATLVLDPDGIAGEPRGANRLYVAMTRSTQELVTMRLRQPGDPVSD